MTLKMVFKKHRDLFVILQPCMRDAVTNRPKSFKVLKACVSVPTAEKAQRYYSAEGFSGVFIYPCFEEDTTLDTRQVARMFRILYGASS